MLYVTWKMDVLESTHAVYKESFSLIRYERTSGGVHRENDLQMPSCSNLLLISRICLQEKKKVIGAAEKSHGEKMDLMILW